MSPYIMFISSWVVISSPGSRDNTFSHSPKEQDATATGPGEWTFWAFNNSLLVKHPLLYSHRRFSDMSLGPGIFPEFVFHIWWKQPVWKQRQISSRWRRHMYKWKMLSWTEQRGSHSQQSLCAVHRRLTENRKYENKPRTHIDSTETPGRCGKMTR